MDRDFLVDLFADFGPVTIRRRFSGFGISADGTNFALALRGGVYLRADDQTIPRFEAERRRTVSISDQDQDHHGQLLLAAAGAAL
jgi:DNA transformation protein